MMEQLTVIDNPWGALAVIGVVLLTYLLKQKGDKASDSSVREGLEANRAAIRSLMLSEIQRAERAYSQQGYITEFNLRRLTDMILQAEAIGANGYLPALKRRVEALEVRLGE